MNWSSNVIDVAFCCLTLFLGSFFFFLNLGLLRMWQWIAVDKLLAQKCDDVSKARKKPSVLWETLRSSGKHFRRCQQPVNSGSDVAPMLGLGHTRTFWKTCFWIMLTSRRPVGEGCRSYKQCPPGGPTFGPWTKTKNPVLEPRNPRIWFFLVLQGLIHFQKTKRPFPTEAWHSPWDGRRNRSSSNCRQRIGCLPVMPLSLPTPRELHIYRDGIFSSLHRAPPDIGHSWSIQIRKNNCSLGLIHAFPLRSFWLRLISSSMTFLNNYHCHEVSR